MKILLTYGSTVKPFIPELKKAAQTIVKTEIHPQDATKKVNMINETIAAIEASNETPKLIRLR